MVSGLSGLPFLGMGKEVRPWGAIPPQGGKRDVRNQSGGNIETARICPTEEETMRWSRMCGKAHYI